jgi:biotin synthase
MIGLKRLLRLPTMELVIRAHRLTKKNFDDRIFLCSIMNAKSGACSEDCAFCAQSAKYNTKIDVYPLISRDAILANARKAVENGAYRIGIVTSGRNLSDKDIAAIIEGVKAIRSGLKIGVCASLGSLTLEQLESLKKAGVTMYHHNIETAPSHFARIVTTHGFEERARTIRFAKKAGLEVCSGGIIGLGETMEQRIEMALTLKKLDADSVPINILVPIPNTPLAQAKPLSMNEIIRTIAIFRIILPKKIIKLAAGRESRLREYQPLAFLAGANSMLIGGYLTVAGRSVAEDRKMIEELKELML